MLDKFALRESICLLVEDQPQVSSFLQESIKTAFPNIHIASVGSLSEAKCWLDGYSRSYKSPRFIFSLIDLGLPDGSGIEIIRLLAEREPSVLNIVVTIFTEDSYLFEALAAGAFGYILKDEGKDFIVDTLRRLERNEPPISPSIARRLFSHFRSPQNGTTNKVLLTPRENQTLTLLVRGLTVAETALQMGLSAQTVSGYVKTIYQKLHVSNRAEATREAIRHGFV